MILGNATSVNLPHQIINCDRKSPITTRISAEKVNQNTIQVIPLTQQISKL
jgi:hypothetical protein